MPTPLADLVRQLGNAGCSTEQIAVAVAHQETLMHEVEQKRREKAALRQARYRDRDVTRRNDASHNVTDCDTPPQHILPPPLSSKPKKVSRLPSTIEIPEKPTEEASDFARSKSWDTTKIELEWQRFRDHSLSKGRKHRNVLAAWRNWVTSPYQSNSNSTSKGPAHVAENRSLVASARRAAEHFGRSDGVGDKPGEPVLRIISQG